MIEGPMCVSDVNLLLMLLPLIMSFPLSTWLCFSFWSVFLKQCFSPRSVSGKKLCSTCGLPLGKGAAMIIETLGLYFHIQCFRVCLLLCPPAQNLKSSFSVRRKCVEVYRYGTGKENRGLHACYICLWTSESNISCS